MRFPRQKGFRNANSAELEGKLKGRNFLRNSVTINSLIFILLDAQPSGTSESSFDWILLVLLSGNIISNLSSD